MSEDTTHINNLQQDTENNLIQLFAFMENLGEKQRRIIWTFHDLYFKYDHIFISQEKLASVIPCCREHINRTISLLCKKGYLKKKRRRRMSNVYHLSDLLKRKDLKRRWKEKPYQCGEVTSKVTSRILTEDYSDKALEGIKPIPPYIPQGRDIRKGSEPIQVEKIKEAFEGFNWPDKDKIAFSKYSDEEIEAAMLALGSYWYPITNSVKLFQTLLDKAKHNSLIPPTFGRPPFSQYSEADLVTADERMVWYRNNVGIILDPDRFKKKVLCKIKKKRDSHC